MPKVSIIIAVYNAENYLSKCLNSAINQTLKDIEIICVDDGSTDNSLEILKRFAKKDKRIIVIHQDNAGQGAALNTALDNVTGEYILNIDCDDWIELNSCEFLYSKSKDLDLDLLFYCAKVYDEYNEEYFCTPYYSFSIFDSELVDTVFDFKSIGDNLDMCVTNWTKFYKASFIKEYSFKFEEFHFQDNIFHWNVFLKAKRNSFTKKYFYYHRIREGQISFKYNRNYFDNIVMSDYYVDIFKKNNLFEKYRTKITNNKISIIASTYFKFDDELRREYWKLAKEDLLNFNKDCDVGLLSDDNNFFYTKIIQCDSFEKFELTLKIFSLEKEIKLLKKENKKLIKENNKLNNCYKNIINSNSWKLTKIKKILKK